MNLWCKQANTRLQNNFLLNKVVWLLNSPSEEAVSAPSVKAFKGAEDID